jgi:hypothetical protein
MKNATATSHGSNCWLATEWPGKGAGVFEELDEFIRSIDAGIRISVSCKEITIGVPLAKPDSGVERAAFKETVIHAT